MGKVIGKILDSSAPEVVESMKQVIVAEHGQPQRFSVIRAYDASLKKNIIRLDAFYG
jgi:hypothetical protein